MKNVLIIHHNDNDGYASAGIVAYYLSKTDFGDGELLNIDYLEADYVQPLEELIKSCGYNIEDYDFIYLLDYSISTDENAKFVIDVNNSSNLDKVTWIDHHKSSIDTIQKYPELEKLKGLRLVGVSATLLCWVLYFGRYTLSDFLKNKIGELSDTYHSLPLQEVDEIINTTHIPKCIAAIHYYDIWDHRNPDTANFKLGYNLTDPESIWKVISSDYLDYSIYNGAVEDGRVISKYIAEQNDEYCKRAGFNMSISFNGRDYSVFALNTDRCTSLTFGDNMDKYDICMPFWYNGKKHIWSHSLYSNKDDVDCSAIAKALGGGGHKSAAGFTMKTCICDLKNKHLEI